MLDIQVAATGDDRAAFEITSAVIDSPRPDEILVRIVGVGICHTDLFFRNHEMIPAPAVLGHEGAGIVERVGADVQKVAPGDHVILTFRSCGECAQCRSGDPAYCAVMQQLNYAGARPDGSTSIKIAGRPAGSNFFGQSSFASHALAYERNLVRIAKDVDLAIMGPLACGVQTGVGAVLRSLRCQPGTSIVIAGGGAVGLSAVLGARIAGCKHIAVVEPVQARRALASRLGATDVIDPADESIGRALRRLLPEGYHAGIDTTGLEKVQTSLLGALRTMGVLGLVGLSKPDAGPPGIANDLIARGITIRGIIEGDSDPDEFLPFLVALYKRGELPFDEMVEVFPFEAINDAVRAHHSGKCVKPVLLFPGFDRPVEQELQ